MVPGMLNNAHKIFLMTIIFICGIIISGSSLGTIAAESGIAEAPTESEKPESVVPSRNTNDAKEIVSSRYSEPDVAGNLIQTTLGLLVVLAVIIIAAWAFKRFGNFQSGMQGKIKIVGGVSLGARERVVLLQIGEKQLVVGVAPGNIQTLHVLDEPLQATSDTPDVSNFSSKLQSAMASRFSNYSNANK